MQPKTKKKIKTILLGILGVILIILGIVLIVLPGPGWPVVAAGFYYLGLGPGFAGIVSPWLIGFFSLIGFGTVGITLVRKMKKNDVREKRR